MRSAAVQETPRHGLAKPAGEVKHRRMRKEELESILGHQVGPIEGWIEALAVERELPASTEKSAHYLRTIAEASRRMGKLIDDLLALSRAARAPLEMKSVRLQALVEEVLRDLRPDTAQRSIDWRIGALPAVHGDPSLLRVVLHNLLDNAVKYTRRRSDAAMRQSSPLSFRASASTKLPRNTKITGSAYGARTARAGATPSTIASPEARSAVSASGRASVIQ